MKRRARLVLFAVLIGSACGSSRSSDGTPDGGGTSGGGGGGTAKVIGTIPLAGGGIVARIKADANGVVTTTLAAGAQQMLAISPSGAASTLYTPTGSNLVVNFALDGQTIYYVAASSAVNGVYAMPRAGGTPTSLLTTDRQQLFNSIVFDASNLYVGDETQPASGTTGADGGVARPTASLQQIAKSSGVATTIYTAPDGQEINNLIIDGSTLYWSETENSVDASATTLRSAAAGGGALSPTTVLVIPTPSGPVDMAETDGWIIGATLTTSSGVPTDGGASISLFDASFTISGGVFALPASGGTASVVDAQSTMPIAVNPGALYLNHGGGLGRATVSASGVGPPEVVVSGALVTQIAADHQGGIYYLTFNSNALYKL